jgi:uncharacterized membrane protein
MLRYIVAALLILAGLVWIGQGLGFIPGSFMSRQIIWAIIGAALVVAGCALAWRTRHSAVS